MYRTILAAGAALLLIGHVNASQAQEVPVYELPGLQGLQEVQVQDSQANDRLVIVNGNNHHVIYDDGRDDLFCVTRLYVAGYTYYGRPIYRRTMHCR